MYISLLCHPRGLRSYTIPVAKSKPKTRSWFLLTFSNKRNQGWRSLTAQWVKDPVLPLQGPKWLLWQGFAPCPGTTHRPGGWQKKKKKKKREERNQGSLVKLLILEPEQIIYKLTLKYLGVSVVAQR